MCAAQGGTWINYKHNYDNVVEAMSTLFIISTFDGWGYILQISWNAQVAELGPGPLASQISTCIFYVLFVFIGAMFFLSFFTGVLYINFKHHKNRLENRDYSQEQVEFIKISKLIFKDVPRYSAPPRTFIRRTAKRLIQSSPVLWLKFGLLIIDMVVLLLYRSEVSTTYSRNLNRINLGISVIFALWVLCNIMAYGVYRYFGKNLHVINHRALGP
jgi:hypothetical protein